MQTELDRIKNKILNKVIVISIIFVVPSLIISLVRALFIGWKNIFAFHIILCVYLLLLTLFRKKLPYKLRLHSMSVIYALIGLSGFYTLGYDSAYYFCFISILLTGFLNGFKSGLYYLLTTIVFLIIISTGHKLGLIDTLTNMDEYRKMPTYWYSSTISIVHISVILLYASTEMYTQLSNGINKKIDAEDKLIKHKVKLEYLVQERTEELETTNEELVATNEELTIKNDIIYKQNDELIKTLSDLQAAQSQLVQSEKMASLGVLTAGVAHEINNPLNFIMGGYLGMQSVLEEIDIEDNTAREKIDSLLESIKIGVDRVSKIVTSLSQFSRNNENYEESCMLHIILDNCLLILHNEIKNKVEIIKKYADKEIFVIGNNGKLHQVFLNILYNSCQAIAEEGKIIIESYSENNKAIIKVTDNGSGIKPEHLEKITDPFFTTKDPGKGTGLGLSISYTIIKDHKGSLSYQSEYGKGTTAEIQLPLYM